MRPENNLSLQNILVIMGIALAFGLLYNFLFYLHMHIEFLESASISVILIDISSGIY